MALFQRKRSYQAGLYLDKGMYRYLALQAGADEYEVIDCLAGEIPSDRNMGEDPFERNGSGLLPVFETIAGMVNDTKIPVFVSLPTLDSLIRIVNMPGVNLAEAKLAFRYEFENYFPFSADEAVYDMDEIDYPLPNGGSEKRFLVSAARFPLVDNIMKYAARGGLNLCAIEPAQIALERAVTPKIVLDDAAVYIYAGNVRSTLTLSWRGNGVFYRSMSIGFTNNEEPGAPALLPEEAADINISFAKEMRSSVQFAASQVRGFSDYTAYLHGPGATDMLCSMLKETLGTEKIVKVDVLKLHGIEIKGNITSGWDIPLGLALS